MHATDGERYMKLLLDDAVYDVPSEVLASWIKATPPLSERFTGAWQKLRDTRFPRSKILTADELINLMDDFIHEEAYCQIMYEAMMDLRETMGYEEFEDYRIDMDPRDVEELAKNPDIPSLEVREPVRIPVTGES